MKVEWRERNAVTPIVRGGVYSDEDGVYILFRNGTTDELLCVEDGQVYAFCTSAEQNIKNYTYHPDAKLVIEEEKRG